MSCSDQVLTDFTHILQDYFIDNRAFMCCDLMKLTKPIFTVSLVFHFLFSFTKTLVVYWIPGLYLASVRRVSLQFTLHWRHNDHDGVSNHQPHGCLLNRLFRRRSKKTSRLRVTGLCVGNSPGPVNSPHKGPVTRKMFPFDDVIMSCGDTQWLRFKGSKRIFHKIGYKSQRFMH